MEKIPNSDIHSFPSNAHRIAWYFHASLLPLVTCIPTNLSNNDAKTLAKGQVALHEFFTSLYVDMYTNPAQYRMDTIEDVTFNDGEWYKQRPEMKKTWLKNAHAFKSVGVLFDIVRKAEINDDKLCLSGDLFAEILAAVIPKSTSRPKIRAFLDALRRSGLHVDMEDDVRIYAPDKPCLINALKTMTEYAAGENYEKRLFAFYRCDFRSVDATYEPSLSDVFQVLADADKKCAERVLAHLVAQGYQPVLKMGGYPSALWRVTFAGNRRLKAGDFFWLSFSIEYQNRFALNLHCINPTHLIPSAQAKGDEYLSWFSDNWHQGCNGCGYCKGKFKEPGPYIVEVAGKKRGLCHQNWMGARSPDKGQEENILTMVDLHTEVGMV